MPQLGETVREGKISSWFKAVGDQIVAGDNLFEIETDKVSMEVEAIESGILSEIVYAVGETVPVGATVAVIGNGVATGEKRAKAKAEASPAKKVSATPAPVAPTPAARNSAVSAPTGALATRGFAPFNEVFTPTRNYGKAQVAPDLRATPLARRLMVQNGLDPAQVATHVRQRGGTRVAAADVHAAIQAGPASGFAPTAALPPLPITGPRDRHPLNKVRQQTAKHLTRAWQSIPHVLQTVEVDFGVVAEVRAARKREFEQQHGTSLSYLPFIARAVCLAIRQWPKVNASVDGNELLVAQEINLGIAVDLSHEGLVVPVLRHADRLNVVGLAAGIARLVDVARAGKLRPDDLEGGTYSISNNGSFGTLFTAPIINAPQVAILSTDAIRKRPVVVETQYGDAIVARPVGMLAQSFDHRAFDGAYSASFLNAVKTIIETRDWNADF
ncbi:dihydrolipoamide acetyltransferase family protein [Beijerinckia sp. GAS462]|nr:dihydrolipoamide acetyltransferase family protein [Beijerinckia sp. GAS462]